MKERRRKQRRASEREREREREREGGEWFLLCRNSTFYVIEDIKFIRKSQRQGRNRASFTLGLSYILAARLPFSIWLGSGPPTILSATLSTNRFTWSRGNNSQTIFLSRNRRNLRSLSKLLAHFKFGERLPYFWLCFMFKKQGILHPKRSRL